MRKRMNRGYTPEFKREALRLFSTSGKSVETVAEELGIPKGTLGNWVRDAKASTREGGRDTTANMADDAEVARLRKELEQVTLERDFLKKAAAFFAKNQS
jgi:transposase